MGTEKRWTKQKRQRGRNEASVKSDGRGFRMIKIQQYLMKLSMMEARRERTGTEKEQTTEQEQGKKVRFREEEQSEETRAQSSDEQDVTSGFADEKRQRKCRSHPRER